MLGILWHVLVGEDGHIDADVCANSKFLEKMYDESSLSVQRFDGHLG